MSETTPTPWLVDDCLDSSAEPGIAIIASDTADRISNPTRGMVAWVGLTGANFNQPETARANAALIVRAVNCHAELAGAARGALAQFRNIQRVWAADAARYGFTTEDSDTIAALEAALAKAAL